MTRPSFLPHILYLHWQKQAAEEKENQPQKLDRWVKVSRRQLNNSLRLVEDGLLTQDGGPNVHAGPAPATRMTAVGRNTEEPTDPGI